jgi:hypothetical protein
MSWHLFVDWASGVTRAEWISAVSALIAALAYWRSGRVRTLDLRTTVRRQCAELQSGLETLAAAIPAAVDSRARITAMTGQTGALEHFRTEADSDRAAIEELSKRVDSLKRIRFLTGYRAVEKRAVIAYEIGTQVRQLRDKYKRAADTDNETRRHRQGEVLSHIGSGR